MVVVVATEGALVAEAVVGGVPLTAVDGWVVVVVVVVVGTDGVEPPPRAREERAEATAAEAACARPPARLPFIAPIMGGGGGAGISVAGSMLFRASISE